MTSFPETRRAWERLKFAWADYWAARVGCRLVRDYDSFSTRAKVMDAIADPASVLPRIRTKDGLSEHEDHWKARAAIEAFLKRQSRPNPWMEAA